MRQSKIRVQDGFGLRSVRGREHRRMAARITESEPKWSWEIDVICIGTHEGALYLSVVVGQFFRDMIGWSMGQHEGTGLVLCALRSALRRRRPKGLVTVRTDHSQLYSGRVWQEFLCEHNLAWSRSRYLPGKSAAERFFQFLGKEQIRHGIYPTRDRAQAEVLRCISKWSR